MKVKVDQEKCISCGTCINICPEVFDFNSEGKAAVMPESDGAIEKNEEAVGEAIESCPVEAISKE